MLWMLRSFDVARIEPLISLRTDATLTVPGRVAGAHAEAIVIERASRMVRMILQSHDSRTRTTANCRCHTRRTCRATACDCRKTDATRSRTRVAAVATCV